MASNLAHTLGSCGCKLCWADQKPCPSLHTPLPPRQAFEDMKYLDVLPIVGLQGLFEASLCPFNVNTEKVSRNLAATSGSALPKGRVNERLSRAERIVWGEGFVIGNLL